MQMIGAYVDLLFLCVCAEKIRSLFFKQHQKHTEQKIGMRGRIIKRNGIFLLHPAYAVQKCMRLGKAFAQFIFQMAFAEIQTVVSGQINERKAGWVEICQICAGCLKAEIRC